MRFSRLKKKLWTLCSQEDDVCEGLKNVGMLHPSCSTHNEPEWWQ